MEKMEISKIWKYGKIENLKYRNMETWKYGNMEIWEQGVPLEYWAIHF